MKLGPGWPQHTRDDGGLGLLSNLKGRYSIGNDGNTGFKSMLYTILNQDIH